MLSKACKPNNFEFATFVWIFLDCESFLESNSPDILAQYETNLDGSINSGNFTVRGYLPLTQKNSTTHRHGLTIYMKERLLFARDLPPENASDFYLCFQLALLYSVSYFFPSINHFLHLYAWFLILFHLIQMRFSESSHLLMCLSLKTLTSIIRTG